MKPLSAPQAVTLFTRLADRQDLGFNFLPDYCFVRAHLVRRVLEEEGLAPQLAWAIDNKDEPLWYSTPLGNDFNWGYHVAVALPVQVDGKETLMIFDPSLFDGPVGLAEWSNVMRTAPGHSGILALTMDDDAEDTIEAPIIARRMRTIEDKFVEQKCEEMLARLARDQRYALRVVHPSPLHEISVGPPPRQGNGWRTATDADRAPLQKDALSVTHKRVVPVGGPR